MLWLYLHKISYIKYYIHNYGSKNSYDVITNIIDEISFVKKEVKLSYLEKIKTYLNKKKIFLIEDSCEALGSKYRNNIASVPLASAAKLINRLALSCLSRPIKAPMYKLEGS